MERKPNAQPHAITADAPEAPHQRRIPLALLLFLMLLPWLWINIGLTILKDYRLTILTYELLGCAFPAFLLKPKQLPLWPIRLSPWILIINIVLVNVVILSIFKFSNGFNMDWAFFYQQTQGIHLLINGYFWLFASYIVILNPMFEELFWRGIIYEQWKKRVSTRNANLISSFFFGAWHWQVLHHFCQPEWAIALSIMVMVAGVVFAYIYEHTRTLSASMILHGLGADLPMAFVVYDCIVYSARFTAAGS
jgi:membrane protease YdiL (CAAX protease family)